MGSCSSAGVRTKENIQVVVVKKEVPPSFSSEIQPAKTELKENKKKNPVNSVNPINPSSGVSNDLVGRNVNKVKDKDKGIILKKNKISQHPVDAASAIVTNPVKSKDDIELIKKCSKSQVIFKNLNEAEFMELLVAIKLYTLEPNQVVFSQGDPGNNFFIISRGRVEIKISDKQVAILEAGMSFGESVLVQNVARSTSAITLEQTLLWGLERETFKKIVTQINAANFEENISFVEKTSVFKDLTRNQKEALVESASLLDFPEGSYIIKEGESGNLLYIIKEGSALCTRGGKEICKFSKGECFGEQALLFETKRLATISAIDYVKCMGISRENLVKVLGNDLQALIYKNSLRSVFNSSSYLKKLSKLQEELLISSMAISDFDEGTTIIPAGSLKGSDLIVVLKGTLRGPEGIINTLSCLGEADLIEGTNNIWESDVVSNVHVSIGFISKSLFEAAIGGKFNECVGNNNKIKLLKNVPLFKTLTSDQYNGIIQAMKVEEYENGQIIFEEGESGDSLFIVKSGQVDVIKKGVYMRSIGKNCYFGERSILSNSNRTATIIANGKVIVWVIFRNDFLNIVNEKMRDYLVKRIDLEDDSIKISDLKVVKLLGKGLSGVVFLTVHKEKKTTYALKTVHKQKIYEYDLYDGIKLEREILLRLDHSFIMKLVKTYKDDARIYFLAEYVKGKDLFDVIRAMNFISEADAKFFVGCLLCALENLHEKKIVYRDLKPENVVVDDEGYLKIIDFGTAKVLNGRTYTILGTPQYMAPEVILTTGYGLSADYWSLGIMLFEFLFGYVPFGEEDNDPIIVYEKVLERNIVYPPMGPNSYVESKMVIEQLLSENPAARVGQSIEVLKNHLWFKNFDWDLLITRQTVPPYIPKVPNIERDIENALLSSEDANTTISKYEDDKFPPDLGTEEDWDKEF